MRENFKAVALATRTAGNHKTSQDSQMILSLKSLLSRRADSGRVGDKMDANWVNRENAAA